jgi:hypothetical protein
MVAGAAGWINRSGDPASASRRIRPCIGAASGSAPAMLGVFLLGACQTTPPQDYVEYHAGQDAVTIAERISRNVGACWFGGDRPAFADYSYAPELSSSSRPRVLIVEKANPIGLPRLVIEVRAAERGADVRVFGPLMATEEARSIDDDVRRWTGGARDC